MGHACEVLTFRPKDTKQEIEAICDTWGDHNCDLEERGWNMGCGLGTPIRWKSDIYESEAAAREYLDSTFGNYRQTAVRFKKPKKMPNLNSSKIEDLKRRIKEYEDRATALNKPHYAGVKSASVKCKSCGAVLPTAYCGKSYNNNCPVCRADLRPASTLEKEASYKDTIKKLKRELDVEYKKEHAKAVRAGYDLCWAVACEVHC